MFGFEKKNTFSDDGFFSKICLFSNITRCYACKSKFGVQISKCVLFTESVKKSTKLLDKLLNYTKRYNSFET